METIKDTANYVSDKVQGEFTIPISSALDSTPEEAVSTFGIAY